MSNGLRPILEAALLACLPIVAGAAIIAVPPATYQAGPLAKVEAARSLLTPPDVPRTIIALPPPGESEKQSLKAASVSAATKSGKAGMTKIMRRRVAVGFPRSLPDGKRPLYLDGLAWQSMPDGGRAARIEIRSPDAAAIRLGIEIAATDPDVALRFVGSARPQQVFGPYPANKIAESSRYWSPVLEGDTAIVELYIPAGVAPSTVSLAIPQLSHIAVAGQALLKTEPTSDIGKSATCEVDVACVTPQYAALSYQRNSVAKVLFVDEGTTYSCTGTLLNDSASSFTPYFFTASHCIDSQEVASTINTYWFFDAVACNDRSPPAYMLLAGGAMLLGRSTDYDWSLMRLNGQPPSGVYFSAWRAETVPSSAIVSVLHHPEGDLKKFSQGTSLGLSTFSDGSSFTSVRYSTGNTEPGSSGSGLIALNSATGYYELRGTLFGGDSSCSNPGGSDYYSRLDVALPLVKQYLVPTDTDNPTKLSVVVEFYNASLNHFFMTSNPSEINDLDTGVHRGWVRTGLRFLAYTDPSVAPVSASPVCRFYLLPQSGDSHFYSADPAECAETAAKFSGQWFYESSAVFYILLPDKANGVCPANTRPVYRFFNPATTNHRFTAEVDDRDCMISGAPDSIGLDPTCRHPGSGWVQEGYGSPPNQVVFCSPNG